MGSFVPQWQAVRAVHVLLGVCAMVLGGLALSASARAAAPCPAGSAAAA